MKIERSSYRGWQFVSGNWVSYNGWNSVSANLLSGCYDYRTTVMSYNDVLTSQGASANLGKKGAEIGVSRNGEKITRFEKEWNSGSKRLCK
jgi:hypothetical protein